MKSFTDIGIVTYFSEKDLVYSYSRKGIKCSDFKREMLNSNARRALEMSAIAIFEDFKSEQILIKSRY